MWSIFRAVNAGHREHSSVRHFLGIVALMMALSASARAQSPAEADGPHFLMGLTAAEQETMTRAVGALRGKLGVDVPIKKSNRYWITRLSEYHGYAMVRERRERILGKLDHGGAVYPLFWPPMAPFNLRDANGRAWRIYQFSLPEHIMTGFAMSRYEDVDDETPTGAYCRGCNERAVALFQRLDALQAIYPGGKTW